MEFSTPAKPNSDTILFGHRVGRYYKFYGNGGIELAFRTDADIPEKVTYGEILTLIEKERQRYDEFLSRVYVEWDKIFHSLTTKPVNDGLRLR